MAACTGTKPQLFAKNMGCLCSAFTSSHSSRVPFVHLLHHPWLACCCAGTIPCAKLLSSAPALALDPLGEAHVRNKQRRPLGCTLLQLTLSPEMLPWGNPACQAAVLCTCLRNCSANMAEQFRREFCELTFAALTLFPLKTNWCLPR